MDFVTAIKTVLGNYANFEGRARRSEYWWFVLFTFVASFVLSFIEQMISGGFSSTSVLSLLFSLAILVPSVAVATRRLHDLDKSGWFQLLIFIPLIGVLVLIYWFVQRGTVGANRFGEDPMDGDIDFDAA